MRIVGGMWRGRSIQAPQGRDTRPTTDRMRESIASMIMSACDLSLEDRSVLDAFAGSGAVGLELLSRGAAHCTFCEKDRKTAALIRQNARLLGAHAASFAVLARDAQNLVGDSSVAGVPFSLVFLDPPYAMPSEQVSSLLWGLARASQLAYGCVVVYERSATGNELELDGFDRVRTKKQGSTSVDLLRYTCEGEDR